MTVDDDIPEIDPTKDETPIDKTETSDNQEDLTEQSSEDLKDEIPIEDIAKIENQLRVFFQDVGLETITAILEKRNEMSPEEFEKQVQTPGSYEYMLVLAANDHSVEADRILKSIDSIKDKSLFESKLIRDGKVILSSILKPRRESGNGKILSGHEARVEFAIKSGQAKRVSLFNSGFHIDIESPNLVSLNDFFTKAHSETNQYSREFGANFFYFNDLLIKEAVIELILPLVMSSSLKNWNRNDTLKKNIKLSDLKVILNALAALMFPDGFLFSHVCTNPNGTCTHYEEMLIDITKLFRNDFMKITNDQIDHMVKREEFSQDSILKYQSLFGFKKTLRYDKIEFELRVPSIEDHLLYGRQFNADLLKSNFAENTVNIYQSLIFRYYQIYTPFIKSVTMYDDDGKKDIISEDLSVISSQLSRLQSSDPEQVFIKDIDDFIASSEITHICYPAMPCPKCGHVSDGDGSTGYHVVDPLHTFFIMALKKLTPT